MSDVSDANSERKVTVAAQVAPDLADAVRTLADDGNRTVSREVARAIAEHVERSAGSGSLAEPAERGETSEGAGQSSSLAAGTAQLEPPL